MWNLRIRPDAVAGGFCVVLSELSVVGPGQVTARAGRKQFSADVGQGRIRQDSFLEVWSSLIGGYVKLIVETVGQARIWWGVIFGWQACCCAVQLRLVKGGGMRW